MAITSKKNQFDYDVVLIGGGITGTALLFTLTNYTDVRRIALFEKYSSVALVASNADNNSQTLHEGDIETNYDIEKARKNKPRAAMTLNYLMKQKDRDTILFKMPKMVLGVGTHEVDAIKKRVVNFKPLFPEIELLEGDKVGKIEPKLVEGRDPNIPIAALYNPKGYAVNYQKLAQSFLDNTDTKHKKVDVHFDTPVIKLKKIDRGYEVTTKEGTCTTQALVVNTGVYSLELAKSIGLGKDYAILPTVGYFYLGPKMLNGKVYMIQEEGLPMAAVHGDRDVAKDGITRFGPRASVLLWLELGQYGTFMNYIRSAGFPRILLSYAKILSNLKLTRFIILQNIYGLPGIGKHLFVKDLQKIVPTLKASDITPAKGTGGVRPQVIDLKKHSLEFGLGKVFGDKSIFSMTPSPGASISLANAKDDTERLIKEFSGAFSFDRKRFKKDFE